MQLIEQRADTLLLMDNVIRSINDEESGVFEHWISMYVPDGSTKEDLIDALKADADNGNMFYNDACKFFSSAISDLIVNKAGWTTEGFSRAFFKSPSDYFRGCPSCFNTDCIDINSYKVDDTDAVLYCAACSICGRSSQPAKTQASAYRSFYDNGLACIKNKDAVLLNMETVNTLINNGRCLTVESMWGLDIRKH